MTERFKYEDMTDEEPHRPTAGRRQAGDGLHL